MGESCSVDFATIEMLDEFRDAAGETKFRGLFRALVGQRDLQALVEKSIFAEARGQRVITEHRFFEDLGSG